MNTKLRVFTRLRLASITTSFFAMSLCTSASFATEYNDPFWTSLAQNADFVDNFASLSLNRNYWDVDTNIHVNGEDQDYKDVEYPAADWTIRSGIADTAAIDGKVLSLKARYMDGDIQGYYGGMPNSGKPLFIRSGRVESKIADNTTFTYGKFEARIKMPAAHNAEFPAWWLLGNFPDVGWTACQELDIIEFTGNNPVNAPQTHFTGPYAAYGGNPGNSSYASLGVADPSNQYVTYGVIKTPEYVEFYVNGVKTYRWGQGDRGDMPWPYVTPMRMILNHAITHTSWPAVGNYNKMSSDPTVANKTGYTTVDANGVTQYEYIDTASMATNIGRNGTDFLVDYVAHWPLPSTDASAPYIDNSKYSFFRPTNNTKGFYSLKGWMAPVAVTADASYNDGTATSDRDNGPKNAADGYVGSKWATPADDNIHWVQMDYGVDKPIQYFWIEWSWNLPKSYEIYGKTSTGTWEYILSSDQLNVGWTTHVFDVKKTYRYIKVVTKGRISKTDPIWLLEFKAFEDVANVYPKPAGTPIVDRTINMLVNGDFSTGINGWKLEHFDGTTPVLVAVNGEAKITTDVQGANDGSYQIHTEGFGLRNNYRYQVSFKARADAARTMVVRLSTDDLNPTVAGTYIKQTVALNTTMTSYTFNLDFIDSDNAGRLSFRLGKSGVSPVYIDDVVIKEIAYIGVGDPLVPALDVSNFVAASTGWETIWWGLPSRVVDGTTANKGSSAVGTEGQDQWITVQIDPNYDVKQVLIAGDKSSPRSLDQFKVEYGNSTTMIDWTPSTKDGAYEAFKNLISVPPSGERNFKLWFRPPAGQMVEVADAQLMAVDNKPYRIYPIALDTNATIAPNTTLRYSRNNTDSATYTFSAPAGSYVSNVIVDGVSQGAITSYTFANISKSHTLAVATNPCGANNCMATLVSAGRPTFASSQMQPSSYAVDGKATTRWESTHGISPSWLTIDLGSAKSLANIAIDWEKANPLTYVVQGSSVNSDNNADWQPLATFTNGLLGKRTDTSAIQGSYRYVRIYCTERSKGNAWGYSIYEVRVNAFN